LGASKKTGDRENAREKLRRKGPFKRLGPRRREDKRLGNYAKRAFYAS
jgi:hypothetical protein